MNASELSPSRAGSLLQGFDVVRKIRSRHCPLWERACPRWRPRNFNYHPPRPVMSFSTIGASGCCSAGYLPFKFHANARSRQSLDNAPAKHCPPQLHPRPQSQHTRFHVQALRDVAQDRTWDASYVVVGLGLLGLRKALTCGSRPPSVPCSSCICPRFQTASRVFPVQSRTSLCAPSS